jgi:hypothetical protein
LACAPWTAVARAPIKSRTELPASPARRRRSQTPPPPCPSLPWWPNRRRRPFEIQQLPSIPADGEHKSVTP